MSHTLEEEGGHDNAPSPLETINDFETAHTALIEGVRSVHCQPSASGLETTEASVEIAVSAVAPFYEHDFFKGLGNDMAVEASLKAVMRATEELADLTNEVHPHWTASVNYGEDKELAVLDCVMSDEDGASQTQVTNICNNYKTIAENLEGALLNCDRVAGFMEKKAKNSQRAEEITRFGLMVLATYFGTRLAIKSRNYE